MWKLYNPAFIKSEEEKKRSTHFSAGSVILESPVHPVMEGEVVNLYCRNKTTSSNFTAYFYKDNLLIGTSFEGEVTVQNVSKSHKGFYKCKIHGVGESPESWMAIRRKSNAGEGMVFLFIYLFDSVLFYIFFQCIFLLVAWMNL